MTTKSKKIRVSKLYSRGWDRDMLSFHWPEPLRSSWCEIDTARKLERCKAVAEDRERVKQGLPSGYRTRDLQDRGWAKTMIRDFLGEPDAVVTLNSRGDRVMYLFRAARVEAAESREDFQSRRHKAAKRSAASRSVSEERREATLADARERASRIKILRGTPTNWGTLLDRALRSKQKHYDQMMYECDHEPRSAYGADDETIQRWVRNYLRHRCTNYDALLASASRIARGKPGAVEVYESVIRPAVDDVVEEHIESLSSG